MFAIHWLAESGEPEPQIVCSFDFPDRAMAADYGFDLYAAVHGFNCSKLGFAIKDRLGRIVHEWRRDGDPAGIIYAEIEEPIATPRMSALTVRARRATGGIEHVAAILPKRGRQGPAEGKDSTPSAPRVDTAASLRRFAPAIQLTTLPEKKRRVLLTFGGDHFVLAAMMMVALLVGSPLYSIYSAVDRMQQGGLVSLKDRNDVAADARAGASTALSTDGRLDFRKLFWHLRVVAPTEIDLLAYDPAERPDGPRIIFTTRDLLRWQMQGVRREGTAVVAATTPTS